LKTGFVWAADFALFALACWMRAGLSTANLLGFAAGAALNAWLKLDQSLPEAKKSASFLLRLLFVSLLAFFLRSGVLGTFTQGFGWPALPAILPAIVTGWIVLFLGYALFIWPVRDQYGSGVRWRVAAIGATAYLLALRIVFLFTFPIDARLAALPEQTAGLTLGDRITIALRHFGTSILGPQAAGMNLPALFCWVVSAYALFKMAWRVSDKTTAFRTLLLFSVLPVFFWNGAVFSEATVLSVMWALFLWGLTFVFRLKREIALILVIGLLTSFWSHIDRVIPAWPMRSNIPIAVRPLILAALQPFLVTPAALVSAGSYLSWSWTHEGRTKIFSAASFSGASLAWAGVIWALGYVFIGYTLGWLGIAASAAIWLPLLPFIAAQMERTGKLSTRLWGPVIYLCILCYGVYFYSLAFGS
jgi:hypothetical protein